MPVAAGGVVARFRQRIFRGGRGRLVNGKVSATPDDTDRRRRAGGAPQAVPDFEANRQGDGGTLIGEPRPRGSRRDQSEQYPKGLGRTAPVGIRALLRDRAAREARLLRGRGGGIRSRRGREQALVARIESRLASADGIDCSRAARSSGSHWTRVGREPRGEQARRACTRGGGGRGPDSVEAALFEFSAGPHDESKTGAGS